MACEAISRLEVRTAGHEGRVDPEYCDRGHKYSVCQRLVWFYPGSATTFENTDKIRQ